MRKEPCNAFMKPHHNPGLMPTSTRLLLQRMAMQAVPWLALLCLSLGTGPVLSQSTKDASSEPVSRLFSPGGGEGSATADASTDALERANARKATGLGPASSANRAAPAGVALSIVEKSNVDAQRLVSKSAAAAPGGSYEGDARGSGSGSSSAGAAAPADNRFASFSSFVLQSVGKPLPVFGSEMMRGANRNLEIDPVSVPADYRIGPGDEVRVRAWGQLEINVQLQVDRSGQIFLPKIGPAMLAGLRLGEVQAHLRSVVARQYKDFELTASLGAMRTVHYYTSGFARKPGLHHISSAATVLHALLAAGGAGPQGDPRRVVVRRTGALPLGIDLYEILLDGKYERDPQIQPGDVIHFEPSRGMAAVAGYVNREAIFHVRAGNTVSDLLRFAGGMTTTANAGQVRIERLLNGRRTIEDVNLDVEGQNRPVRDGDLLLVLPVSPRIHNVVTLRGNVAAPLRSPWKPGMHLADLITDPSVLVRPASVVQQNERSSLAQLDEATRDIDIQRDYPEVYWDFAAIERLDLTTHEVSVLSFDLGKLLFNKDAAHNLELRAGDHVIIYARKDFEQPETRKLRLVRVEGEVQRPGIYSAAVGESLVSLLQRAGGITEAAYVFGTVFTRISARKQEEQRIKLAVDRVEQDFYRRMATRTQNVVPAEDGAVMNSEMESVRTLVAKLRNYKPEGRVTLDLQGLSDTFAALPKLDLEDGDTIYVPRRPATVTVAGAVVQEGTILWRTDSELQHYLDSAGGLRRFADRDGVIVLRADGTVRTSASGWFGSRGRHAINPGDTILVSEDVDRVSKTRSLRDWAGIFGQFGLGVAAFKVLGL